MRNILIFILSIVGLIVSVKLGQIYFDANFMGGTTGHFCSINTVVDCNGVAQSPYSTFLGIPLALYGAFFYLSIIGLLLLDKLVKKFRLFKYFEDFKHPLNYIHLMAIFSIFVAVSLAYISTFEIGKICILCYITYGINALIFIMLARMSLRQSIKVTIEDTRAFIKHPRNKLILPLFIISFGAILFIINQTHVFLPSAQQILDRGNVLGDRNSYLRVYVYTDYNCHYCAQMNKELHRLVENMDGVRIERIEYPIDKTCNPKVKCHGFKNSCQAARYALAAKEQGKYVMMSSLLFENKNNLSEKNIIKVAQKHGINTEKLCIDANSQKIKDELTDEIRLANETGINSTPSLKIGVKIYNYYLSYDELYAIVSRYKNVVQ